MGCNPSEKDTKDISNRKDTLTNQVSKDTSQPDTFSEDYSSKQEISTTGIEYTADYICPNRCKGSGSNHPGNCSVCGMELIPNPNADSISTNE